MTAVLILFVLLFAGVRLPRPLRDTPVDRKVQQMNRQIGAWRRPGPGEAGS